MPQVSSELVKSVLISTGFHAVGITRPQILSGHRKQLEDWILNGFQGEMSYLERNMEIREDIRLLFPEVRSVVCCLMFYDKPSGFSVQTPLGKISRYAAGPDYHLVIREKFSAALKILQSTDGGLNGRFFTDSAPVFEREYARLAGLGWIGNHSLLIAPKRGSWFFIGIMLLNRDLEPDQPFNSAHCGTCTACSDACPADAILPGKTVNAVACISYQTIEKKSDTPDGSSNRDGWIWGCDRCQEVCPWNKRFSRPPVPDFFPADPELASLTPDRLAALSENKFRKTFSRSPLIRRGKKGLIRNISLL